jgi:hypothetical protein
MSTFSGDIIVNSADVYALSNSNLNDPIATDRVITQATNMIETMTGVFFRASDRGYDVRSSDAAWLRKAVVFQTVWMLEQGEVLTRQGISSLSQDGVSVSAPDELTFVLAPLAKRALNNCSWTKNGTLKVSAADEITETSFLTTDVGPWVPLGAA